MMAPSRHSFVAGALALTVGLSSCGDDQGTASNGSTNATPAAPTSLTAAEREAVLRMREEEKLARDLYVTLAGTSGDQRFVRIARSEQRHFDLVGALIARYGLPDPAAGAAPGEFDDSELQALYDRLERAGRASAGAAVAQGVVVEQTDIADIDARVPAIKAPELQRTLALLRAGSERHLAAFQRG